MSHHEHDPMKGHHRPADEKHGGWNLFNRIRHRSNTSDKVVSMEWPYPGLPSLASGHRDAPLTPLARLTWWLVGFAIVAGGISLIVLWIR
jgi:hypothetical protein